MDNFQNRRPHRQLWSPLILNTLVSLRKEGADPRDDRSSYSEGDKFVDSSRVMNHVECSVKQTRQPQHTTRLQLFDMAEIEHFSDVSSDSDDFIEEEFDPEQFLLEEFAEGIAPYRFEPYLEGPANDPGSDSESDAEERGEEGDAGGADAQIPMDIERLQNVEWCSCGRCEAMPTVEESVCCQEQMRVVEKRERVPGILCITEHHGFQTVCLDEEVLETAHNGYQDHYGEHLGNE
ncbi:hypothetical protein Bbelb_302970 [Branchiostoma belcheri]|nr:hypothetical protein Bbelb_302970 [Branchiostoma belcheri]